MRDLVVETLQAALRGRYAFQREIGRGGAAVVYLASDLKLDRLVAVKVLHSRLGSALASERFLREIKLLAQLQHPHILPLHDSGDAQGLLFFVTPYIDGETLQARLDRARNTPLPLEETLRFAREIADALDYAHRQNIVHRDIKPGNILISNEHATVADFGIARAIIAAGDNPATITDSGITLGTPPYMSPEQLRGEKKIDGRSDIYSLGCVVFELLTGRTPFARGRADGDHHRKLTQPAPRMSSIRTDLASSLDDAVARALATQPADRFATASRFAAALTAS